MMTKLKSDNLLKSATQQKLIIEILPGQKKLKKLQ